eukprot:TRINITY_DN32696_c0_g1_i1.p1 TRINITY_DN32696_c0_g1~~TRINITY_DN32696_c0_g1_i1.p1  ORF type:complete len:413 (+),score=96.39 TRINITY_DN32696_c0_g1_i1:88-1239(+)
MRAPSLPLHARSAWSAAALAAAAVALSAVLRPLLRRRLASAAPQATNSSRQTTPPPPAAPPLPAPPAAPPLPAPAAAPGPVRFVVLSAQRSGSNWLHHVLAQHPELRVFGEELIPTRRGGRVSFDGAKHCGVASDAWAAYAACLDAVLRRTDQCDVRSPWLLRRCVSGPPDRRGLRGVSAQGLLLKYDHVPPAAVPEAVAHFARTGVRVVHLTRANSLEAYLSHLDRRARYRPGKHAVSVPALRAFAGELRQHEQRWRFAAATPAGAGVHWLEVGYERLLAAGVGGAPWQDLLRFLSLRDAQGLAQVALVDAARRGTPAERRQRCSDRVENWREVAAALQGSDSLLHCCAAGGAADIAALGRPRPAGEVGAAVGRVTACLGGG